MTDLFGDTTTSRLTLADKYLMAPTSVMNTREGKWQQLKKKWIRMGIQSEIGREDAGGTNIKGVRDMTNFALKHGAWSPTSNQTGVSIFDPVLCEIIYKWFAVSKIIDPFAGGSVRGIVAAKLGYNYTGVELRPEQVDSNRKQAKDIVNGDIMPKWIIGDSNIMLDSINDDYDTLFTCPPYYDLEVYSDLTDDLSNMDDEFFNIAYESIMAKACGKLITGAHAIVVVSDVRGKDGYFRDLTGLTKRVMDKNNMGLYNEIILINPVGSKALTMDRLMKYGKIAKVHQNVLVFKKR